MKLSIKGLALAFGIVWGAGLLFVGMANQVSPEYGSDFLRLMSIYPGYTPGGFGSVLLLTVWGVVDGAVAGAAVAWLYNRLA